MSEHDSVPQEVLCQITSCCSDAVRWTVRIRAGNKSGLTFQLKNYFRNPGLWWRLTKYGFAKEYKSGTSLTSKSSLGLKHTSPNTQTALFWFLFQLILWIFHLILGFCTWACENLFSHSTLPTCTWCLPATYRASTLFVGINILKMREKLLCKAHLLCNISHLCTPYLFDIILSNRLF